MFFSNDSNSLFQEFLELFWGQEEQFHHDMLMLVWKRTICYYMGHQPPAPGPDLASTNIQSDPNGLERGHVF